MIKTSYKNFLLENLINSDLKYYIFDWDDNILVMPTIIHVEHLINDEWTSVDLTTSEFSNIRTQIALNSKGEQTDWRLRNQNYTDTYCEFRDYGPRGDTAFPEDMIKSIKSNNFGPVWDKFIKCIVGGHVFMIITARGHEPLTLKFAINWLIYNYLNTKQKEEMELNLREFNILFGWDDTTWTFNDLVKHYLEMCDFVGIYSKYFTRKFNTEGQAASPEKYKAMAIRYFIEKIDNFGKQVNKKVKVGFSDDDTLTAKHIYKFMKNELFLDFPIDYSVFHTKNGIKKL